MQRNIFIIYIYINNLIQVYIYGINFRFNYQFYIILYSDLVRFSSVILSDGPRIKMKILVLKPTHLPKYTQPTSIQNCRFDLIIRFCLFQ